MRIVPKEGMPQHRNPFEKGRLFIQFKVAFPANNWTTPANISKLEALLPARPPAPMVSDDMEDAELQDYDPDTHEFGKVGESADLR